jgi:hypothetical protein
MKLSEEKIKVLQIQTGTAIWHINVVNSNLHLCDTENCSFDTLIDDIDEAMTYLKYAKKGLLKEKKKCDK